MNSAMCDERLLESRVRGAYLGLAIGDALGSTVEFMTANEIKQTYKVHNQLRGGGWLRLPTGQVTDDTEMSLALGDSILENGAIDSLSVAEYFSQWLRSKPVDVGQTVRRGILHFRKTGDPVVEESTDAGNGACMRTLPVAIFTFTKTAEEIEHESRRQTHVTHHNELSDAGCEAVIAIVHSAMHGNDKRSIINGPVSALVKAYPVFAFNRREVTNPSGYIVDTLQAVFQAFSETNNFFDCLVNVVNRGGDADTTGAIAGMIAGSYYGAEAIPSQWLDQLNQNISRQCKKQAVALLRLALARPALKQVPLVTGVL